METTVYKKSLPKAAQMKEKKPTTAATVGCSPAQAVKQPKTTQHSRRRCFKSQQPRRRPANAQLRVQGRRCFFQDSVFKRFPPQSQERRLRTCYCSLKTTSGPSKTAGSLSFAAKTQDQPKSLEVTAAVKKGKTEYLEKPGDFNNVTNNQRRSKKLSPVEKRKYQTLSEYQFVCPGRAVFHCTKESVKQQLRSIYVGRAERKAPRPGRPVIRIPPGHWETERAQRQNLRVDAKCPVGNEFLRSMKPTLLPCGLTSLTRRISKLALVNDNQAAPPQHLPPAPAGNQDPPQQPQPPPPHKSPSPEFPRTRNCTVSKAGEDQGGRSARVQDGAALAASPAGPRRSPRPRPVSAMDHWERALDQPFGKQLRRGGPSWKEDAAKDAPGLHARDKAALAQAKSAIVVPTISQCSSRESVDAEGLLPPGSTASPFLARMKQQLMQCARLCPPAPKDEELDAAPARRSCEERGGTDSLATPGGRRTAPSSLGTPRAPGGRCLPASASP